MQRESQIDGSNQLAGPRNDTWSLLPDTAVWRDGVLHIGGCSLDDLAAQFGTPLYVYDEATLRNTVGDIRAAFEPIGARVSFAAKACSTIGVLRVLADERLGLDVVSLGEIKAGLRSGFAPESIHLHGNAKSRQEIECAVKLGFHAIVLDNIEEIETLVHMSGSLGKTVRVMLRVSLDLEAKTHPHLQTGGRRSKFGFYQRDPAFKEALCHIRDANHLEFVGLHTHLGSQISDASLYARVAEVMVSLGQRIQECGLCCRELNVGGGWAVPYRPGEARLAPKAVADALQPTARVLVQTGGTKLAVEPGRAVTARAGLAIYRVCSVKKSVGRIMVAVDGGMGDNPRPALYDTQYTALRVREQAGDIALQTTVVGRFCESGDLLVRQVTMPPVMANDLICVPVSGAYQLSMASTYNLVPPPAAIMVSDGNARLLTRRATVEDLLQREM
ncbi:MAG TPA: diaminopimelate decarboxylase [Chloroflexota bacterium]